jgi:gas vesicle protein
MEIKNKGQAGVIDLMLFSLIIILAIAFLQVYSVTHASTSVKNMKYAIADEYAANTLLVLSHISARGAGYRTVQHSAVSNVSDEDLEGFVNGSLKIRNYTRTLDARLDNWSRNVTNAEDQIESEIDGINQNLTQLREALAEKQEALTNVLDAAKDTCEDILSAMNSYSDAVGAEALAGGEDPCAYPDELNKYIINVSSDVFESFTQAEDILQGAKDAVHSDAKAAQEAIEKARCLLSEVNVKLDGFISYAQLGVNEKTTIIDLVPALADLETKTVTEVLGEALYVEDRLAESDALRAAGAVGVRAAMQSSGMGLNDTRNRIAQASALTIARKDYKENAKNAVGNALDNLLAKQGYSYCFKAATCCDEVIAGDCGNVPYGTGHAVQEIDTQGNETAEMSLDIWRE